MPTRKEHLTKVYIACDVPDLVQIPGSSVAMDIIITKALVQDLIGSMIPMKLPGCSKRKAMIRANIQSK